MRTAISFPFSWGINKKNLTYTIAFVFVSNLVLAQTDTENYIKSTTYQVKTQDGTTNENGNSLVDDDKIESITYYDGLGRPKQSITKQVGGQRQDIITPIVYDEFGRQAKNYLPYSRSSSSLDYELPDQLMIDLNQHYILKYSSDLNDAFPNPYSEKVFEASPLNRVLEQAAPGNDWAVVNGHTIKFDYRTNSAPEVRLFSVSHPNNNTQQTELVFDGYYNANKLYKTITKDENWIIGDDPSSEEYKDKQERVVLKRTHNDNEPYDTYYVYDNFGNLTYVIPPEASDEIVIEGEQGFRVASQTNYSWIDFVEVDKDFAERHNNKLKDYENAAILNADIDNEYGGQGGFAITTLQDSELVTLSISFSATQSLSLKQGQIVSLKDYGEFKDTELGKLTGSGYNYIFTIKNNAIFLDGEGKLSSINQTFSSNTALSYSQNYPWTSYADVDSKFATTYESQLKDYPNNDILGVLIDNDYGGQGGLNIAIDENDIITLTFNSSTTTPIELKKGLVIPLNIKRRMEDRNLGNVSGTGYNYNFSIKENSLQIEGEGRLSSLNVFFISPPRAVTTFNINPPTVEGLCYIYHYDFKNRLVEKKIPGKGWEYIVYDKLDRPILTQDAKMRLENKWLFTKYDAFSRVIYTGIYTIISNQVANRLQIQNSANSQTNPIWYEERISTPITINTVGTSTTNPAIYYSNNSYPVYDVELLTINYYDDYPLDISSVFPNPMQITLGGETTQINTNTKSLATGSKVRILGTDHWITTVMYYDGKTRLIYVASNNDYLNTTDVVTSQLDFVGKVLKTESSHVKGTNAAIVTLDAFTYDHTGRLLTQTQTINGSTQELIVSNHYDELGQLVNKNVGGNVAITIPENSIGLQTVDYAYNIRGWLKSINNGTTSANDLFGFELKYNNPAMGTALYNGNISETHWQTAHDNQIRSYDYTYDSLNRLTEGNYHGNYSLTSNPTEIEDYSIPNLEYDKNGNIRSLERKGLIVSSNTIDVIDNLTYIYSPLSNQLNKVSDVASEDGFKDGSNLGGDYAYDVNGNMILDKNKDITSITYNHLNLPSKIEFTFTENPDILDSGTIDYIYDATGIKQQKKVSKEGILARYGQQSTIYAGNYIYDGFTNNEELKFFNHPEGYVEPNGNSFQYVYQMKDHLGNIRLTYADSDGNGSINPNTEIISESNYYPFGLKHKGYNNVVSANSNSAATKFGFGGKEHQDELGLGWIDITARNYDPALGRWMNLDPLAEQMRRHSPYNYAFNNPIYYTDPDGMAPQGSCCGGTDPDPSEAFVTMVGSAFNGLRASVANLFLRGMRGGPNGPKINARYVVDGDGSLVLVPDMPAETPREAAVNSTFDVINIGLTAVAGPEGALAAQQGRVVTQELVSQGKKVVDKAVKKADFVVSPDGTAIANSSTALRKSLDDAGFDGVPTNQTSEVGTTHIVPTGNQASGGFSVRVMDGGNTHGPRAVTTQVGNRSYVLPNGANPPNGTTLDMRKMFGHTLLD